MADQLVVVLIAFGIFSVTVIRATGPLSASALFTYLHVLMAIGTFPQLDYRVPADVVHGWIITWVMLAYMLVSALVLLRPLAHRRSFTGRRVATYRMTSAMWALLAVSVVVTSVYYLSVGSSALLDGLRNSVAGGNADIATQRLDAYAGSRYLFPGYVNQFKNILLPALTVVIITERVRLGRRKGLTSVTLAAFAAFALLGTGQRGHFVMFAVAVVVYLYLVDGRRVPRVAVRFGALALGVVVVATLALGRSSSTWSANAGMFDKLSASLQEFARRATFDQQLSSVYGFRYIYDQDIQYGREWLTAFAGVLPGASGSNLSNQIYASMFGTDRGTAPPSLWGSVFHNFGFAGVAVAPVLLAVGLGVVTRLASRQPDVNTFAVMGMAGVFTTLGFWAIDSPLYLLNNGIVVFAWMWWWGARVSRTSGDVAGAPVSVHDERQSLGLPGRLVSGAGTSSLIRRSAVGAAAARGEV